VTQPRVAESHTSEEIADLLHISRRAVERHRENILAKLGLTDRIRLHPLRDPPRSHRRLSRQAPTGTLMTPTMTSSDIPTPRSAGGLLVSSVVGLAAAAARREHCRPSRYGGSPERRVGRLAETSPLAA
jgi:hypothetical protein